MADITADEYLALLTDHQSEEPPEPEDPTFVETGGVRTVRQPGRGELYAQQRNLDRNIFTAWEPWILWHGRKTSSSPEPRGRGESYLAQALGHQACMMEHRAIYANTARLLKRLKLCKVDGTYLKELDKILKTDLLILDDFGLQSFDNHAREALMDIIDDRYNKASTIISSQIPVSASYDIIGESTIADAI